MARSLVYLAFVIGTAFAWMNGHACLSELRTLRLIAEVER
jgi:hypothetical protein